MPIPCRGNVFPDPLPRNGLHSNSCKGRGHKGPTVEHDGKSGPRAMLYLQGTRKGRMFRKRHQAKPEYINDISNRAARRQLRLGSRTTVNKTFRTTVEVEIAKQKA
jgi:hypothetical protein